jgi:hypothetical protein
LVDACDKKDPSVWSAQFAQASDPERFAYAYGYSRDPALDGLSVSLSKQATQALLPRAGTPSQTIRSFLWASTETVRPWVEKYFDTVIAPMCSKLFSPEYQRVARQSFIEENLTVAQGGYRGHFSHSVMGRAAFAGINTGWSSSRGSEFLWRAEHTRSGGGPAYWAAPYELFARAMESLVQERLKRAGCANTLLVPEEPTSMMIPPFERDRLLPHLENVVLATNLLLKKVSPLLEEHNAQQQAKAVVLADQDSAPQSGEEPAPAVVETAQSSPQMR